MPRGDIKYIHFIVNDPYGEIIDYDMTEIYFSVKKTFKDRFVCFQKKLSNNGIKRLDFGDYMIKIEPQDTRNMVYGNYVFDIQLRYKDLLKESFAGTFILKPEATFEENEG